jgi:hypothetical protein
VSQTIVAGQQFVQTGTVDNPTTSTIEVEGGPGGGIFPTSGGIYEDKGTLTNEGLILVDGGTANASGVSDPGASFVVSGMLDNFGSIDVRTSVYGAASFDIHAGGAVYDQGLMTVEGSLDDAGGLEILGGFGPTGISLGMPTGATSPGSLLLTGEMSIEGQFLVGGGGPSAYGSGAGGSVTDDGVLSNSGSIALFGSYGTATDQPGYGAVLTVGGNLDNTGSITLYGGKGTATEGLGGQLIVNGTLTNAGTITLTSGYGFAGEGAMVSVAGLLTNTGSIDVGYGDSLGVLSTGLLAVSGMVTVGGSLDDAGTLTLAGGSGPPGIGLVGGVLMPIGAVSPASLSVSGTMSVEGSMTLDGGVGAAYGGAAGAALSDSGLVLNSGVIVIDGGAGGEAFAGSGASLTVDGSLDNSASIFVGGGGAGTAGGGGARLAVGGTLTNTGTIDIQSGASDEGGTSGLGGQVSVSGLLNDTGNIDVASGASLDALGGGLVAVTGTITVEGAITLEGGAGHNSGSDPGGSMADDGLVINTGSITVGGGGGGGEFGGGGASLAVGGRLENDGYLAVGGGGSAAFSGGGGAQLTVAGTLTNAGTLELGAGQSAQSGVPGFAASASVSGLLTDAGSIDVAAGASLVVTATGSLDDTGAVTLLSGATLTVMGEMSVTGRLNVDTGAAFTIGAGGDVVLDPVASSGSGGITVQAGGALDIQTAVAVANLGEITLDAGGMLRIDTGLSHLPTNTIDLVAGATIDFVGTSGITSVSEQTIGVREVIQITAGQRYLLTMSAASPLSFSVQASPDGQEIVAAEVPCFLRGTLIRTPGGEVPVEDLVIGDRLVTHAGGIRPIRWIGRRSYAGRFAAGNRDVLPVRIRAGALADGVPRRDLFISPLHAMFVDGMLIPASALVNGTSITQLESVEQVEYIHVELDTHDVIFAEGAPSETFVDDDSRGMFHNAAEYSALYPDMPLTQARYCAPRVEDGEALEALRQRLAARARPARSVGTAPTAELQGHLDLVRRDIVEGWAWEPTNPGAPVALRIFDQGVVIGEIVADRYRRDLEDAGIGDGRHSFSFAPPGGLSPDQPHVISLQRASDGCALGNSPMTLPASVSLTAPPAESASPTTWRGHLETASRGVIEGWAWDGAQPDAPVALQILDNGAMIGQVLANRYRRDLEKAGIGTGRHSFVFNIPGGLSPEIRHVIHVRMAADGRDIDHSPWVIEASTRFDAGLERSIANAVDGLVPGPEQDRVLDFMVAQADRLLQQRAEAEGQRAARQAHRQFVRRWGDTQPEDSDTDTRLRALVLDDTIPAADRDAGSNAILSHMRALQRLGYAVSFVATRSWAAPPAADAALVAAGVTYCRAPFYASVEEVLRRQAGCFDVVYLHRVSNASKYLALARQYCPKARIVYSVADLHHMRLARQAAVEDRPELLGQSRRLQVAECAAAWSADAVITHSTHEAAWLRQAVPGASVHVVPWDVPARPVRVPFGQRSGVAFIGGYAHAPNVDAARFLVETVMPLVWARDPAIGCLLVGSAMPDVVTRLARPGVVAVGAVEDLGAAVFDRVRLTVAPLRYGAGVKGKVLDSFAAGIPCVMSEVAAEGMTLPRALRALVGRDAAGLAELIHRVHADEVFHSGAAQAGLAMIQQDFVADAATALLDAAIQGIRPKKVGVSA